MFTPLFDKNNNLAIYFIKQFSEVEWIKLTDECYLAVLPKWFNWLGWVFIPAGLEDLSYHTDSLFPRILLCLSYVLLLVYFFTVFGRINVKGFPFISNSLAARILSAILTGLTAWGGWLLVKMLAYEIAKFQ